MKKEVFINEVRNAVAAHYGEDAVTSIHDQIKNNGVRYTGLCVKKNDSNIGPTIYLEPFYECYKNGTGMADIVKEIVGTIDENTVNEPVNMSFFRSFGKVRDQICFKLVGKSRNGELLKDIPHREYLDMAIVYYVSMEVVGICGSVLVKNEHMDYWGVTEEELYNAAIANTPSINPVNVVSMADMLMEMMGGRVTFGDQEDCSGMFVASNVQGVYGAACILYPGFLDLMAKDFAQGFYVLPASVHEVIIIKDDTMRIDARSLADMVRSVNSECLKEQDILSDSVYYYDFGGENNLKKVEYDKEPMVL